MSGRLPGFSFVSQLSGSRESFHVRRIPAHNVRLGSRTLTRRCSSALRRRGVRGADRGRHQGSPVPLCRASGFVQLALRSLAASGPHSPFKLAARLSGVITDSTCRLRTIPFTAESHIRAPAGAIVPGPMSARRTGSSKHRRQSFSIGWPAAA